jgi:hypothetical protein
MRLRYKAAEQIVSTSAGEGRASRRKVRYAFTGILPSVTSVHDASSKARCCSGEYSVHAEKSIAFRPSLAPRAMRVEKGGIRVYQRDSIALE